MNSFNIAEEYIQLRKRFACSTWGDTMVLINELIVSPLITLFLLFLGRSSPLSGLPTAWSTFQNWKAFLKYQTRRFEVQRMMLQTIKVGGPFIVTNDPTYMPYVFADAVMRTGQRY